MNLDKKLIPINIHLECKLHFLRKEKDRIIQEMSIIDNNGHHSPEMEIKCDILTFLENQIINIECERAEHIENVKNTNKPKGSSF